MNENILHILVGIDFTEGSAMALAHALKLAERTRSRLHLGHVAPGSGISAEMNLGMNIPAEFPEAREARAQLERVKSNLGTALDVELHVRIGAPVKGMLALIHELKPDLVVICSHDKGMVERTLRGSISASLVQQSPVPIMVVPTPGREATLYQPEPPKEPELPSVGRAVTDTHGIQTSDAGIAGTSGSDIRLV